MSCLPSLSCTCRSCFFVPGTAQASTNPAISEHVVLPCLNMLLHTIDCGTTVQTTATPPVSTDQQGANEGQGSQAPPPAAGDTPLASYTSLHSKFGGHVNVLLEIRSMACLLVRFSVTELESLCGTEGRLAPSRCCWRVSRC